MGRVISIFLAAAISVILSCNRDADIVKPSRIDAGYVDTAPGEKDLEVKAIYPTGSSTSRGTDIVVVFSKPVNSTSIVANSTIILSGATLDAFVPASDLSGEGAIVTLTPASTLANNTAYTVTVKAGIAADSVYDVSALAIDVTGTFTTVENDSETANAIPRILELTRYPYSGDVVSKTLDYVEVTFSGDMDPATITTSTFTITGDNGGITSTSVTNINNRTFRLELDNATVDYDEHVNIALLAGITSSSGVALSYDGNHLWDFDIEVDPDVAAGADAIGSVWITNVTANTAQINWTTNRELSGSTVSFGTDSGVTSTSLPEAGSETVHSITISLPNDATRYYFRVNSGTDTSTVGYFLTKGDGTQSTALSTELNDKVDLSSVRNTNINGTYDGSSAILWRNSGTGRIKASFFDNDILGTKRWAADGEDIDTNSRTNPEIFTDGRGYFITTMIDGSNNIYTKRFYNTGGNAIDFTWGGSAGAAGILVGAGSDPSMSVVWGLLADNNVDGGAVAAQSTGTSVVLSGNWFYDFSTDFTSTTLVVGDAILDRTGSPRGLSVVTNAGTTYAHAINQDIANIISGDTYYIGDGITNLGSFTATDHTMHSGTVYTNGATDVYTPHGFPRTTTYSWLGADDVVFNGTEGAIVSGTGVTSLLPNYIDDGTANADRTNHLIDGGANFVAAGVTTSSFALNTTTHLYAQLEVTGTVTTTDIELTSDLFPDGDEGYIVFSLSAMLTSGMASATSFGELVDSSNIFQVVPVGSYVLNITDGTMAVVTGSSGDTISLSADIFTSGESYQIWSGTQEAAGTANADRTEHLIDGTVVFTGFLWDGNSARWHAVNTSSHEYSLITSVDTVDLTLSVGRDIFPTGTENYAIYNLAVDTPIESGTSYTAVVPGKLADFTAGQNFYSASIGDFAMNNADKTITTISGINVNALGLNTAVSNVTFSSGNAYAVYTSSNNTSGTHSSGVSNEIRMSLLDKPAWLTSSSTDCYAINTTADPDEIAYITGVSWDVTEYSITLNNTIFPNNTDTYVIVQLAAVPGASGGADVVYTVSGELVDTSNDFSSVSVGSYIINSSLDPDQVTTVTSLISHSVNLTNDIFTSVSTAYQVVASSVSLGTGNARANRLNHLIDGGASFPVGYVGYYARNNTTFRYAEILSVTLTDLELSADIFTVGTEGYTIIQLGSQIGGTGAATSTSPGNLVDSTRYFSGISVPVPPDYIYVINMSTGEVTTVDSVVNSTTLNLADDIIAINDNYQIWEGTEQASGTATSIKNNHLIDGSATWTTAPVISTGDFVLNTSTGNGDIVTGTVTDTDLEFNSNIFTAVSQGYQIYSDYCVTHLGAGPPYGSTSVTQFYQIQVDYSMATSAGNTVEIFDYKGITGAADALPTYPLLDNSGTFTAFVIAPLLNYYYVMNTATFDASRPSSVASYARVLTIDDDIFTINGDTYALLRFSYAIPDGAGGVITSGGYDGAITGNELNDSSKDFDAIGIEKGDLVYCVTTQEYAVVISAVDTQIVMNKQIFSAAGQSYIIFDSNDRLTETGVHSAILGPTATLNDPNAIFNNASNPVEIGDLVRNQTTNAEALVTAVAATQLTLSSAIMNIGDRYVVVQPRAFFAFENSGEIYAEMLRLRDGSDTGATISIYTGGSAGNVHTASDGNGGVFVLYESAGVTIFGKRITADGVIATGGVPAVAGLINGSSLSGRLIQVLPDGAGNIYVLYENGVNVYLTRLDSTLNDTAGWPVTINDIGVELDSVMIVDKTVTPCRPIVAYSRDQHVYVSKYTEAGGSMYSGQLVNTLTIGASGTYYSNSDPHKSNISIVSDGSDGAVISWVDTRFIDTVGFTIHSLGIDSAGAPVVSWNADSAGSDFNGIMMGIISSTEEIDLGVTSVNYNDGAGAWNPRVIWQDYRNSRSDLYYQDVSY